MINFKLFRVLVICSATIYAVTSADCNFVSASGTYICSGITDIFPNKFYGRYFMKCVNCRIPVFGSGTFPIQAEILSFNATESGIRNITKGAFGNLPLLEYLYLHNNKLSEIVPGAFEGLRQLKELTLDRNELSVLTPEFLRGLQTISVSMTHNRLKEIHPNVFKGTLGIFILNLASNNIGILHVDSFAGLENLEILELANNSICYIPLGIFKHVSKLRELNLAKNRLKFFVSGTFSGLRELLELNLAENEFTEFNSAMLLSLNRLSRLDISKNGLYYLDAHNLHLNVPTLRILMMDDNLWSCTLLTNLIRYFKTVNIEIGVKSFGRYELTNVNGIVCLLEDIHQQIPFEKFLGFVEYHTNKSINYC